MQATAEKRRAPAGSGVKRPQNRFRVIGLSTGPPVAMTAAAAAPFAVATEVAAPTAPTASIVISTAFATASSAGLAEVLARRAFLAFPRFIDPEGTSSEIGAIESADGVLGLLRIGHAYEGKAPRAAGLAIVNNLDLIYSSVGGEYLGELLVRRFEREVADKDVHE